jgi:metal-sulfur cluster biosynthetic enzyme
MGIPACRSIHDVVREALREVIDPTLGINLVDLGLVFAVHDEGETVRVVLGVTAPFQTSRDVVCAAAQRALRKRLPQLKRVQVERVLDPVWHPGLIDPTTRRWLGL